MTNNKQCTCSAEAEGFRRWARKNHVPGLAPQSSWHTIVRETWEQLNEEWKAIDEREEWVNAQARPEL
jgi:hypothetical protein